MNIFHVFINQATKLFYLQFKKLTYDYFTYNLRKKNYF